MFKSGPQGLSSFAALLRGKLPRLGWILAAVMVGAVAQAQEGARQLEAIEVNPLPGQRLELRLRLNENAPQPLSFTIDDPARIALDLPDTALALPSRRQDVNLGPISTVLAAEANGRTRIVLNLNAMVPYSTRVEGNSVFVEIGDDGGQPSATFAAEPAPARTGSGAPAASGPRSISNIDFRRGPDGAGQVLVELNDPRTTVDVREEGGRVIVDFQNTALPTELLRRLDVADFATPVATVDALRANQTARLVVTPSSPFEQVAYQADNLFTLELKTPPAPTQSAGVFDAEKEYTGDPLTLTFQDLETRAVLQLLADFSNLNIVVSDTVQGNVTLRLQDVPWDQALDIVMTTKGLDMRRNGNVIIVAPAEEIAAREQAQLEAMQSLQELEPLRSEFIQVNYAKAGDLANLISGTGNANALLSERGSVAIDVRTNTLLVQDTGERLADIRRLVTTLDIPIRQVSIESRIVIVNDDYGRELGARKSEFEWHSFPGRDRWHRRSLQRQSARREPCRLHRTGDSRLGLSRGSRALGASGRGQWRNLLDAEDHHSQQHRGADLAGCRDSISGVFLERCDDHAVQGGRAQPDGDSADHARRPDHHGSPGDEGLRRRGRAERDRRFRAEHRYARRRDAGAGKRRRDSRPRRYLRDRVSRYVQQGASARRYSGSRLLIPLAIRGQQQGRASNLRDAADSPRRRQDSIARHPTTREKAGVMPAFSIPAPVGKGATAHRAAEPLDWRA